MADSANPSPPVLPGKLLLAAATDIEEQYCEKKMLFTFFIIKLYEMTLVYITLFLNGPSVYLNYVC